MAPSAPTPGSHDQALRTGGMILAGGAVGAGLLLQGVDPGLAMVGAGLVVVLLLGTMRRRRGRDAPSGENRESVWEIDRLRRHGYRVVHGVDGPQGRTPHAVVGPAGVFAAHTLHWTGDGDLRAARTPNRPLAAARADAVRLEAALERPVQPLLVVGGTWMDRPGAEVQGVVVVPARGLAAHLETRGEVLSPGDVEAVWRRMAATG